MKKITLITTLVLLFCGTFTNNLCAQDAQRPVPTRVGGDLPEVPEDAPVPTRVPDDEPPAMVPVAVPLPTDEPPAQPEPEIVEEGVHTPFDEPIVLSPTRLRQTGGDSGDPILANFGSDVPLREVNIWIGTSGGFARTARRQHEAFRHAQWANINLTATVNLGSFEFLGRETFFRAGASIEADYGNFHSSRVGRYSGDWVSGKAALVLGFRHGDTNDSPGLFDAEFKFGFGARASGGQVGRGSAFNYQADRETHFLYVAMTLRLLWPMYGVGTDADPVHLWGQPQPTKIIHGFLPFFEISGEYQNAVTNKADTTVTDAGGRDAQRDNQGQLKLTLGLWRSMFQPFDSLLEVTPYVGGNLDYRVAYGYQTVENGDNLLTVDARLGVRIAISRRVYAYAEWYHGWELKSGSSDTRHGLLIGVGLAF